MPKEDTLNIINDLVEAENAVVEAFNARNSELTLDRSEHANVLMRRIWELHRTGDSQATAFLRLRGFIQ